MLRNITLMIESFNSMPRWLTSVRIFLSLPLSVAMIWVGFFNGASSGFFTTIGSVGIVVMLGNAVMIGGGILTTSFWRELEHIRRATADQPASR